MTIVLSYFLTAIFWKFMAKFSNFYNYWKPQDIYQQCAYQI